MGKVGREKIMKVDVSKMILIDTIMKKDIKDDLSIYSLTVEAKQFILNKKWCKNIINGYLAKSIEGIMCVYFFEIEPSQKNIDNYLWVIVGDIPPAYLVIDNSPDANSAINTYVNEMRIWIKAVKNNESLENIIPLNVPPEEKYADMLETRMVFIEKKILNTI